MLVKPAGDFIQASDSVNRLAAAAQFMVFTLEDDQSCFDIADRIINAGIHIVTEVSIASDPVIPMK